MSPSSSSVANDIDFDLLHLRRTLTPSQRLQAMFDARDLIMAGIRARMRKKYPELSTAEINLKVLEHIERAKKIPPRP